jgi:N-methylhydantoinase A
VRKYRIGIDVGGTFTDVVVCDDAGGALLAKAASTPADQSLGVLEGLLLAARRLDLTLAELLEAAERIVHGTTVATNALLERKGARVAFLTTEGHRDILDMREGLKPERYDLRMAPPVPLVPRALRLAVRERIDADGRVRIPLDDASLDAALDAAAGAEAVAIGFLHAWRDPVHEQAAGARVRERLPDAELTLSSDVLPELGEFDRFSTAVANAYVGPVVSRYLARLADRLRAAGFAGNVFVVLSHRGVAPLAEAQRMAAATALSGPAGGVAAGRALAALGLGEDLVTFDMGGTSTDAALIERGQAATGRGRAVAGVRIALPSLDIETVGAGGGSIAHLGADGVLRVGPASAGAVPGPACYGVGGTEPTVTDANLVLGYLDPARFLGGARRLDVDAARGAMARIADPMRVSPEHAAAGVHRLVNLRMADGLRHVTVRRGVDPRGLTLLAFGGAAGLHASGVARELGMRRAAVPLFAAGLSAWGMLNTPLRYEAVQAVADANGVPEDDALRALFDGVENAARSRVAAWAAGAASVSRSATMRYGEQIFDIAVPLGQVERSPHANPLPGGERGQTPSPHRGEGWREGVSVPMDLDWSAADLSARVREKFHARHRALFTYDLPNDPVALTSARAAATLTLPPAPSPAAAATPADAYDTRRMRVADAWLDAPVFDLARLGADQAIEGPAIVESDTTTVLLLPGDAARMDARGWLEIRVGA